MDSSPEAIK